MLSTERTGIKTGEAVAILESGTAKQISNLYARFNRQSKRNKKQKKEKKEYS